MSRIFEALRKTDAERAAFPQPLARPPEAQAAPERAPAPGPEIPPPPAPAAAEPPTAWGTAGLPALPEDFQRELAGLKLHVDTALADRRPRVLLFTASVAGEGTTTVAASFARVVARDPAVRVLLVDANARRPSVALFLGMPDGPGLAQALASGPAAEELVRRADPPNLHAVVALPGDGGDIHLYSQPLLRGFLGRIGHQYDYVIFDAPPVLEAPETLMLGTVVDTSILVVRAASTKGAVLSRSVDVLAKGGVPVLGVVLNRRRHDIPEFLYRRI